MTKSIRTNHTDPGNESLVDTSIWSVALRHSVSTNEIKEQLYSPIEDARVAMIGPIRQELLSGIIKSEAQFNRLKNRLEPFRDIPLETAAFPRVFRDHISIF